MYEIRKKDFETTELKAAKNSSDSTTHKMILCKTTNVNATVVGGVSFCYPRLMGIDRTYSNIQQKY